MLRVRRVGGILIVAATAVLCFGAPSASADGELDLSFGSGGYGISSTVGIAALDEDMRVNDAAVAPGSGKVVLVGQKPPPDANAAIAVLNANGTPDTGFSGDGFLTDDFADDPTLNDSAVAVVVQPDGKIVIAGNRRQRRRRRQRHLDRTLQCER